MLRRMSTVIGFAYRPPRSPRASGSLAESDLRLLPLLRSNAKRDGDGRSRIVPNIRPNARLRGPA